MLGGYIILMLDKSSQDPTASRLTSAQRRHLAVLERHLDSDEPALAQAMRAGQDNQPKTSPSRVVIISVIGVPLVVLSATVAGAMVATMTAVSLASDVLAWTRPRA